MMSLQQVASAAGAIGNQVNAGIPITQAVQRMGQLQPAYTEFWLRASALLAGGGKLSDVIGEVWPKTMIAVIRSGEESGKIGEVFERIEQTVELQMQLRSKMMGLMYPVGMGLAGLGVFLGFMVFVLPMLAKSMGGKKSTSFVFQFSEMLSTFVHANWVFLIVGVVAGLFFLVTWLRTEAARDMVMETLLGVPIIKEALRNMYFGLWANYMSMMVSAGIPTVNALKFTAPVLPGPLAESINAFAKDVGVNNHSLSDAADLEKLNPNDARVLWWPFFISSAFIVSEQTGEIDRELNRVAPALIKDGIRSLERFIAILNVVALAVSAFLITSPLAAYYLEIFSAIRTAG